MMNKLVKKRDIFLDSIVVSTEDSAQKEAES